MDSISYNKVLVVTDDQFSKIRQEYNTTKDALDADIDHILTWYEMQPHLPQITLDRSWIERILITNKCSLERTKMRLDNIFLSRNEIPDIFQNRTPRKVFESCRKGMIVVPLPKLTMDNKRILITRIVNPDSDNLNFEHFVKLCIMIAEYRLRNDYFKGDITIFDMENQTLGHFVKFNPILIKKIDYIIREVFGNRVSSIYLLNGGPILHKFITLLRAVLSQKLASRIQVIANVEELHKLFPKDILPKDYGGFEKTTEELYADLEAEICSEKNLELIKASESIRSDETKRPGKDQTDDIHGIAGSFRKLAVD